MVSTSNKGQDQSLVSGSEKGIPDMRNNMFMCEVCDVELSSEVDLKNHIGGKKHQSKLTNSCNPVRFPNQLAGTLSNSGEKNHSLECLPPVPIPFKGKSPMSVNCVRSR